MDSKRRRSRKATKAEYDGVVQVSSGSTPRNSLPKSSIKRSVLKTHPSRQ